MTDQIPKPVDEQLQNKCPSCGWKTLFIGNGGWITCSNLDCKHPDLDSAVQDLITQEKQNLLDEVAEQAKEQNTFASPTTYVPLSTIEELRRKL